MIDEHQTWITTELVGLDSRWLWPVYSLGAAVLLGCVAFIVEVIG